MFNVSFGGEISFIYGPILSGGPPVGIDCTAQENKIIEKIKSIFVIGFIIIEINLIKFKIIFLQIKLLIFKFRYEIKRFM